MNVFGMTCTNDREYAEAIASRIKDDMRSMPHESWQHLAYKHGVYPKTRVYKWLSWMFA